MALTESEIQAVANATRDVAKALKAAKNILDQTLASTLALSIDWGTTQAEDALENNATNPTSYTAAEISNALGSFTTFNSGHWDAGNGGNYELLLGDTPIV